MSGIYNLHFRNVVRPIVESIANFAMEEVLMNPNKYTGIY